MTEHRHRWQRAVGVAATSICRPRGTNVVCAYRCDLCWRTFEGDYRKERLIDHRRAQHAAA